jgi:hypothetical protein
VYEVFKLEKWEGNNCLENISIFLFVSRQLSSQKNSWLEKILEGQLPTLHPPSYAYDSGLHKDSVLLEYDAMPIGK